MYYQYKFFVLLLSTVAILFSADKICTIFGAYYSQAQLTYLKYSSQIEHIYFPSNCECSNNCHTVYALRIQIIFFDSGSGSGRNDVPQHIVQYYVLYCIALSKTIIPPPCIQLSLHTRLHAYTQHHWILESTVAIWTAWTTNI